MRRNFAKALLAASGALIVAVASSGVATAQEDQRAAEAVIAAQENVGINTELSIETYESGDAIVTEDGAFKISADGAESIQVDSTESDRSLVISDGDVDDLGINGGIPTAGSASNSNVEYAISPYDEGNVKVHSVIKDANAPERYRYDFPDVDAIVLDDESGTAFLFVEDAEGYELVGGVDAPWAVDAAGVPVPTHFEIDGGALIQVVEHKSGDFTYPVVADPSWWDNVKGWFKNASSFVVGKAKSAANWLGKNSKWLAGRSWSAVKNYGPKVGRAVIKKAGPGALVLCAVGGGWAWYRSDAKGWVRVGDAVAGCFL